MQPEEVLKLIGSASERYNTVRAALRYRGDGPTRKEIRERIERVMNLGENRIGMRILRLARSPAVPRFPHF